MSDFEKAIQTVLKHEGGFFHNAETGEVVNFGITLKFLRGHGFDNADEQFVKDLTADRAKGLYRHFFWDNMRIRGIDDQQLATAVLDITVNQGPIALKLFQQALNQNRGFEPALEVDGILGEKSLEFANKLPAHTVLHEFLELAIARYESIVRENPQLAANLAGWKLRARSLA